VLRVTLRNLLARKVRLLLSAFAIILGVAFVAGTLVFTNAMGGAFDDIIEGSTSDVEVAHPGATDFDSFQDARTIPASVVEDLEELPEAAEVYPNVNLQNVYLIGEDGKVVGGNGPPGFGFNENGAVNIAGDPIVEYVEGEPPSGPGEVALDEGAAEAGGYTVGDEVQVTTPGDPPVMTAELTGIVRFGSGTNGATLTLFETGAAQEQFLDGRDVFNSITLRAADGVSQEELAEAVRGVAPDDLQVRTGDEIVEVNKEGLDEILGGIRTFLLVFAGVSLFVGIFLIVNTFSILVAQRSRELALLRALGASRRQVTRSVLTEALAVGLVGATVGLGVGYALALGLRFLFGVIGLDLGDADFPLTLDAVIASYAVGLVVTAVAGIFPARRASRVAPIEALRDDVALPESALLRRVLVGVGMVVVGGGLIVWGFVLEDTAGLWLIAAGLAIILIGVALASPVLARPLVAVFGVVYRRVFGSVGTLATQNAARNPRRTGATASALMIGLTLMSLLAIFSASATASTRSTVEEVVTSQYIVSNVIGQPFSPQVAEQIEQLDGVSAVSSVRQAFVDVDGSGAAVGGIEPEAFGVALALPAEEGSLQDLRDGTVAVDAATAANAGLGIGDTVEADFQGGKQELEVVALLPPAGQALGFSYLTTQQTLIDGGLAPVDAYVYVVKEPSADTDEVREAIEQVIADQPTVTVKDPEGLVEETQEQVNLFLYIMYALLGLAIIIAILGVVNTLSLSVIERTREVGLLRAVGVTRAQLRRMITLEAIVIGVFGALLGVALGTVFGIALVKALEDQGLSDLAIPWPLLVTFVVVSGILGILAALFPAFRASRLNVLRAITVE
jgi:putative ABC transport system permease protein